MRDILLTGAFHYTKQQVSAIERLGCRVSWMPDEADYLPHSGASVSMVVCNGLFQFHDIYDFANLKFIQLTSAGLDRVPVDTIKERGIELHNARGVYSVPMAEWALMRVLERYKHAASFMHAQAGRMWTKDRNLREIAGSKVAIVGAGNVGREVARRMKAFDAEVIGFDPFDNGCPLFDSITDIGLLESEIDQFDIIVLTAPLTPETHHLFSYPLLERLKKDAMLVNIARGALIDTQALVEIFQKRSDVYAALDVFEEEPLPSDSPLWNLSNVAISPHNKGYENR